MTPRIKRRSPLGAAVLSLLLVGLGQIYAGRLRRGLIWMAIGLAVAFPMLIGVIPTFQLLWLDAGVPILAAVLGCAVLFRFAAVVDAYWMARRAGSMPLRRYQRWYVYVGLWVAVMAVVVTIEVTRPDRIPAYRIPTAAMFPTLRIQDIVFGADYGGRMPERGEVAVYYVPEAEVLYLKRIVGLPGDRVRLRGGRLHLNGEPVPREAVSGAEGPEGLTIYRETLPGGRSYLIAERSDAEPFDDTEEFVLGPDQYFALGDNRDGSRDSRVMGPVPREQIRTRLFYVFLSLDVKRIASRL